MGSNLNRILEEVGNILGYRNNLREFRGGVGLPFIHILSLSLSHCFITSLLFSHFPPHSPLMSTPPPPGLAAFIPFFTFGDTFVPWPTPGVAPCDGSFH